MACDNPNLDSMRSSVFEIITGGFLTWLLISLYGRILPPAIKRHGQVKPRNKVTLVHNKVDSSSVPGETLLTCRHVPGLPAFLAVNVEKLGKAWGRGYPVMLKIGPPDYLQQNIILVNLDCLL